MWGSLHVIHNDVSSLVPYCVLISMAVISCGKVRCNAREGLVFNKISHLHKKGLRQLGPTNLLTQGVREKGVSKC